MNAANLGDKLIAWASGETTVHLLVLIGSRTRTPGSVAAADAFSDWDFQVATSQPEVFETGGWLAAAGVQSRAYVRRTGRLGSAQKVSAVTNLGEVDLVVIPVQSLRDLADLVRGGRHAGHVQAVQALADLSAVVTGGYRILKGSEEFADFYEFVTRHVPAPRLDDPAVRQLAEAFVCDYVFTCRKIERGELIAAQRWLHHQLAEMNFRLLHERRLREGHPSFPDARRLELLGDCPCDEVTIAALPGAASLRAAVERAAATHRGLVSALLGGAWRWPL